MERYNKAFNVQEVLALVPTQTFDDKRYEYLDGQRFKRVSQRLVLFKTKGCKCVQCGLEGTVFYLEKHKNDKHYHFNLYGYDTDGKEVMLTKDHVVPKSKGGKDVLENYQTMCSRCNEAKADKF